MENSRRHGRILLGFMATGIGVAACHGPPLGPEPPVTPRTPPSALSPPPVITTPPMQPAPPIPPERVPDAVPRLEPRSLFGNPPFYDVFGIRYYVLPSSTGYRERGVASWYGPGFHAVRTSTGEPYDMYAMTAAHKTLPLPAYVRVTNLQNGRSVVVRVNDRGPFVNHRIIDLSYTAAAKLDMLRNGTAMVEVDAIDPTMPDDSMAGAPRAVATAPATTSPLAAVAPPAATSPAAAALAPAVTAPQSAGLYIQAGAFASPQNAEHLAAKLRSASLGTVFVRANDIAGRKMYRVRIGPVPDVAEFDRVVAALERVGVADAHLALD
jgi:rare lipoprotein A